MLQGARSSGYYQDSCSTYRNIRSVDIGGRRSENAGHMKEISTLTATLLLT